MPVYEKQFNKINPQTNDITAANGNSYSGIVLCNNFNNPAGSTITITDATEFICSGTFTNTGTINVTANILGGADVGGALYYGNQADPKFGYPGLGLGGGKSGDNITNSSAVSYLLQKHGSGGSAGVNFRECRYSGSVILVWSYFYCAGGGNGGGSLTVRAIGAIANSGIININGTSGVNASNSLNNTQYFVTTGCTFSGSTSGGGGGGSGGYGQFSSNTSFNNTGTINCKGGDGGDIRTVYYATSADSSKQYTTFNSGGTGGSGGTIIIESPSNIIGTISVAGGTTNTTKTVQTISGSVTCTSGSAFDFIARGGSYGGAAPAAGSIVSVSRRPLYYF